MSLRIHVLSDLHLECQAWTLPRVEADLIVLAGDICDLSPAGEGRRDRLFGDILATGIPAVYVMGNHEGYAGCEERGALRRRVASQVPDGMHFLDQGSLDILGYRILGCGLWTDFSCVEGLRRLGRYIERSEAMHIARCSITDFHFLCDDRPDGTTVYVTPEAMSRWHASDRAWLDAQIQAADRPVVVVTHFLPHPACVAQRFAGSVLNAYFATDCSALMRDPVRLWIHGHTHASVDTRHGPVRLLCNPRGYAPHEPNHDFNARLVVTP